MQKSVIFLVHGMGSYGEGWIHNDTGPVKTLKTAAKKYSCFQDDKELIKQFEFVEVRYDHIFQGLINNFEDLAESLKTVSGLLPANIEEIRNEFLEYKAGEEFIGTHVADVLLYQAFPLVRKAILLNVISTIASKIAEENNAGGDVMFGIVAHSLGTAVTHDALHHLANTVWLNDAKQEVLAGISPVIGTGETKSIVEGTEHSGAFSAAKQKLRGIFMVSNTSNLLYHTELPPNKTLVRPYYWKIDSQSHLSRYYININHEWDPISHFGAFSAVSNWPKSANEKAKYAEDVKVHHVHDLNIHGFSHYLKHPKVNGRIFEIMNTGVPFSTREEIQSLEESGTFKNVLPKYKVKQEAIAKLKAKFSSLPEKTDLPRQLYDYYVALKNLGDV